MYIRMMVIIISFLWIVSQVMLTPWVPAMLFIGLLNFIFVYNKKPCCGWRVIGSVAAACECEIDGNVPIEPKDVETNLIISTSSHHMVN